MGRKDKREGFNRPFAGIGAQVKVAAPAEMPAPPPTATKAAPQTDDEVFLAEVAGVAPLTARTSPRVGAPARPPEAGRRAQRASDDAEVLATLADLCDGAATFDITDSDEYIEGLAAGVDRRVLKRLRAGDFALQGHVDLHGLTREQARERVGRFLNDSRKASHRCVLIVHGRGQHSKDHIPVLKEAVKSWLERGQLARAVLAFATARPHDGGAGAVYVLLRK